ncbi:histidine phosphatase family protein [Vibrio sp.]|nr:histidine phosphatase family protein [Vibrio sp.]
MKRFDVWLLRHGQTEGKAALNGHYDAKVKPEVQRKIIESLQSKHLSFETIISSPLSRCLDLAKQIEVKEGIRVVSDLQEMNFGDYDGKAFDEIPSEDWVTLEKFWCDPRQYPLPRSEPIGEFYQRVTAAWSEVIESISSDTLIVTHGGVIRMILASVLNLAWDNPALFTQLAISNQTLTHLQVLISDQNYVIVKSIGATL